jgi:DNA-binding NarL/FixJ family response regulator
VTRTVIDRLAHAGPQSAGPEHDELAELTPREREVLALLARGLSNAEIAAALVVEDSTVETHVKRALTKLRLRDRVQGVIYAYERGLARPAPRG